MQCRGLRKVAYLCAIMAAVQSSAVLYGTIIMNTISSNSSYQAEKVDSLQALKQSESEVKYSFYDWGSRILQSISDQARLTGSLNDAPRITSAKAVIPEATFNAVTYKVEPITEDQTSSKGIFPSENSVDLLLSTGNESFADSRLPKISSWDLASQLIGHGMPGLVALGYEN